MEEDKRVVAAVKQSVYYRNYRRARERALVRLAQAHSEDYRIFLAEERAKDEANNKTWTSSGTTIITPDMDRLRPHTHTLLRPIETNANNGEEGDVGGEK